MTKTARPTSIDDFLGILIVDSWDEKRNPTKLKLCAKVEADYMISADSIKIDHRKFAGKSVTIKGKVQIVDGANILTVLEIEEQEPE